MKSLRFEKEGYPPFIIHWSWFLMLGIVGLSVGMAEGWANGIGMVLFFILLYVCVILHEIGHCLAAHKYGSETVSISIFALGGLALIEDLPTEPKAAAHVAIAGPLVNLGIIGVLFPIALLIGIPENVQDLPIWHPVHLLLSVLVGNFILFFFNMIPAFPLDGGRILRSAFGGLGMTHYDATLWAVRVGYVFAALFVYGAFAFGNPMLFLIAVFIVFLGYAELQAIKEYNIT